MNDEFHSDLTATLDSTGIGNVYDFTVLAISDEVIEVKVDGTPVGWLICQNDGRFIPVTRKGVALVSGLGFINFQLSVLRLINNYRKFGNR